MYIDSIFAINSSVILINYTDDRDTKEIRLWHPVTTYLYAIVSSLLLCSLLYVLLQLVLCLLETIVLVVHCLSKPYEKKWINIVEALILLDLFVATVAILQQQDPYVTRWLVGVVMALPFVYAAAVGTYLVGKYLW